MCGTERKNGGGCSDVIVDCIYACCVPGEIMRDLSMQISIVGV